MRINTAISQNMFRPQIQNSMQRAIGQVQNSDLQKIVQQINSNCNEKKNRDAVKLSKKELN